MSRKTEVVKEMQKVSADIERIERELEFLRNVDVKYVDSIQLDYIIPDKPPKKVLFPTPNGKGAKSTVEFIIGAYEDMLAIWNELLDELAKKL